MGHQNWEISSNSNCKSKSLARIGTELFTLEVFLIGNYVDFSSL